LQQVRNILALAIASIAHNDWPEEWPQLMDTLLQALESGQQQQIESAMQILKGKQRPV
jgi:hypothetical protein